MFGSIPKDARVFGIGLGIPGYMDIEKGISLNYSYIRNWENVNLKQEIEQEFKISVFAENNINAMALAYKWLNFGGICNNFIFLSILPPLSGAICCGEEVMRRGKSTISDCRSRMNPVIAGKKGAS